MAVVIGIDGGSPDVRAAEHLLAELVAQLGEDAVGTCCTHLTQVGGPHVVLSLEVADGTPTADLPVAVGSTAAAVAAAAAHAGRTSGRAVRFAGQDRLVGELTVGELLAVSAVERVTLLAGAPPEPSMTVATGDFVRPLFDAGLLTLHTVAAVGGRLAPFEVAHPTPCCADHA